MRKSLVLLSLLLVSQGMAEDIPEVQVTATRVEVPIEHVGDDVEVITKEEIEKYGFTSIADVLKYVAGVHVVSSGGWGKQTSVWIQGLSSEYILVLVNGIPINDPSTPGSTANFEWIDLSNVERIEVLKGSQSALYGSEAIAGVINIITKEPKKDKASITLEGGSYKTFKEKLKIDKIFNKGFSSIYLENFKISGFSATTSSPDDDPFRYTTGGISFGFYPTENLKIITDVQAKYGHNEYDNGEMDYKRLFAATRVSYLQSENLIWNLKTSTNREKREYSYGNYIGYTNYLSLSPTYYFNEKSFLKAGINYRQERAETSAVGDKEVSLRSAFVEGHTEISKLYITGVGRIDNHSLFGYYGTYKLSGAYSIDKTETTFKLQYGTGFKAPTIDQLYGYYPGFSWNGIYYPPTKGNPDLSPEKSRGWTVGVVQKLKKIRSLFELNYFRNYIWNKIQSVNKTDYYTYENIGSGETKGIEVKARTIVSKHLSLYGKYTYINASENIRDRVPENSYIVGLNFKTKKLKMSTWIEHYSERKDGENTLSPFTTLNCYASYKLNDKTKLYLKGVNLTDEKYELAYGYNTMGRSIFAGVDITFK
ncbi:MAG: TonB-dependent receptor [Desulfurobacteriaceae bacterium]